MGSPTTFPAGRKVAPAERADEDELLDLDLEPRPRTRAGCATSPRPCPYVSCKHHLYLEVHPETGTMRLVFPGKEIDEMEETCALDVAEHDGSTLKRVGDLINLTRERVRQIEVRGIFKLRGAGVTLDDFPAALLSVAPTGVALSA